MTTGRCLRTLSDPVPHLARLLAAAPQRRLIVGLAGLPGSGKSTLARRLERDLNRLLGPGTAVALGMDGFHLSRAQLAGLADPAAALRRRGAPWTFDPLALAQRLRDVRRMPLSRAGEDPVPPVRWPGFEHGVGDPVPDAITVPASARLVLLEGLYLLHRDDGWDLAGLLDACWFLELDPERALQRLAQRHMASWGLTRQQAQARVDENDRLNALTVLATRERADWLVVDPAPEPTA